MFPTVHTGGGHAYCAAMAKDVTIIIISGISGSGKSTVLRTLEDLGFFCIDNLPVLLLPKFIDLCSASSDDITKIGLVIDVRERAFLKEYRPTVASLRSAGYHIEVLFLDCSNEALLNRFSETRRQHPLRDGRSVLEDITRERALLAGIRDGADRIIDTSALNVHELRHMIEDYFNRMAQRGMTITFMSFGYKYGIPHEADIVQDVRFLPNPFFIPELRPFDGRDARVADYVFSKPEAAAFIERFVEMLAFQIPLFEREGKSYLTIAVGCTGGRHRSVSVATRLTEHFAQRRQRVFALHRDIERT